MESVPPTQDENSNPPLERALSLSAAVSIVIGTVIGSGVFLVPSKMIRDVGSPFLLFTVWIVAGLLSLFGALTYAELAAAMPEAGGEYVFLSAAYGRFWGFLYGWTQFWVAKSGSIATLAAGFYTYLTIFYPALGGSFLTLPWRIGPGGTFLEIHYGQLIAILLILALAAINYVGVRSGGGLQVVITYLKMTLIGAVIVAGLLAPSGSFAHFGEIAQSHIGVSGFFAAMVSALWAYDGWNNVSMVSSEITHPQRNLPRSLIVGTSAVVVTYLLINVAYTFALTPQQIAGSKRVAADMMFSLYGPAASKAVSVAVLISIFAAINGSILSGSRIPYAMARDGVFFRPLARVHPVYRTPGAAIVALSLWSCVVVLSGWYDDLYNFVIFGSWILYGLTAASVFVLRRRNPGMSRPYRVIGYPAVPVLFVSVALLLLTSTFQSRPREALMGLVLMASGVPFYYFWQKKKSYQGK
jgi:basic amino acid/polyamine antiporter, APA family